MSVGQATKDKYVKYRDFLFMFKILDGSYLPNFWRALLYHYHACNSNS